MCGIAGLFDTQGRREVDRAQIVVDDFATRKDVHHDGLEEAFVGDEAAPIESFETSCFGILADKFAEAPGPDLPLRSDIRRRSLEEFAANSRAEHPAERFDEAMAHPVHRVGIPAG